MGYSFDLSGRLCCDHCGASGKVRKRVCPYKVHDPASSGSGYPYCMPAALCSTCYQTHKATLHATCKDGAAASTARYRAEWDRLQAGDARVRSAFGSWHPLVPSGFVGVVFRDKDGGELYRLIPDADYAGRMSSAFLGDFAQVHPWTGPTVAPVDNHMISE